MAELPRLAKLLSKWNSLGNEIAATIGRPAQPGHIAEYVAAKIFQLRLSESASQKGIDGYFMAGALAGRSVNIKWTAKQDNLLNLTLDNLPDYYLVLAGPKAPPMSSRGQSRPWVIDSVFLFENIALLNELNKRGVKIDTATSVIKRLWDAAEIYPSQNNPALPLSENQRNLLSLFG